MTPEERARLIWESTDLECEHNRMTVEQLADEIRAAVAVEREACAEIIEAEMEEGNPENNTLFEVAAAIRARSSHDC